MPRTLAAVLVAVVLLPAAARPQTAPAPPAPAPLPPRSIRVSGDAHVSVRPDVAIVNAGVTATGKDLSRVNADAAAQMRKVLETLGRAGVAEKDVQTTRHDVAIERPWDDHGRPGPITGYTVSDEVRITVRDVAKLGVVLERVLAAGSNTLRGLAFEKDDPTPERGRALALAIAAARSKAEAAAKAAGVTLGEVLWVDETGGGATPPPPYPVMMARADARKEAAAPVSPGEVEIQAAVQVTFAIR
jgi:uncharacterized protein